MKSTLNPPRASLVLCFLLGWNSLLLCFILGCTSTAPTIAYKGEVGANAAVVSAMTAWGSYVAIVHPGTNAEAQVKGYFDAYKAAELALIDATAAWAAQTPPPTNTPPAVIAAQTAVTGSASNLVNNVNLIVSTK